jgi:hypothetical protein
MSAFTTKKTRRRVVRMMSSQGSFVLRVCSDMELRIKIGGLVPAHHSTYLLCIYDAISMYPGPCWLVSQLATLSVQC